VTRERIIVLLFFVGFFGFTVGEMLWLHRAKAVTAGRAFAFSFASNIFCITVGFFVSMAVFGVMLAVTLDNSVGNIGIGEATFWGAIIVAALFPLAILTLAKFFLLKMFRIATIENHFLYSLAASGIFFLAVTVLPGLFGYIAFGTITAG